MGRRPTRQTRCTRPATGTARLMAGLLMAGLLMAGLLMAGLLAGASACNLGDPAVDASTDARRTNATASSGEGHSDADTEHPAKPLPGAGAVRTSTRRLPPGLRVDTTRPATDDARLPRTSPSEVIVHQTGLISSVVGSDGRPLTGLRHRTGQLPPFVHRLNYRGVDSEALRQGDAFLPEPAISRLDLAATWVHSPRPAGLQITAELAAGYPSDWYPTAAARTPETLALSNCPCSAADLAGRGLDKLGGGSLGWTLEAMPPDAPTSNAKGEPIDVPSGAPWAALRQTDASSLRTSTPDDSPERFLGYGGVTDTRLPLNVTYEESRPRDTVTFTNTSDSRLDGLLLLDVHEDEGRVIRIGGISPRNRRTFSPAPKELPVPIDQLAGRTRRLLGARLEQRGLSAREASAAAEAFVRDDLLAEGIHLLFVMPRPWIERHFPLSVAPKPDDLVRAWVGRLEILAPEDERRAVATLESAHQNDRSVLDLARGDRFAEPTFRRACQLVEGQAIAAWCERQLDKLDDTVITGDVAH